MHPRDPWIAASMFLDQLEEGAEGHAMRRITALTIAGDQAGANVWSDILAAIIALRRGVPRDGEGMH